MTSVYAATGELFEGRKIRAGSWRRGVTGGYLYGFHYTFDTQSPADWLESNEIAVLNNNTDAYLFGLAQDINVNNEWTNLPPLFACELLGLETEMFTTSQSFFIFLGGPTESGYLTKDLRRVARSQLTQVVLTPDNYKINLSWSRTLGRFITEA